MNVLLVSPGCPETFCGFKYVSRFALVKRTPNPPLGLLTVASMLPQEWEKKLIDMNVMILRDKDLGWADLVFVSAMAIHRESIKEIITRCQKMGVKIVAGGPLFTSNYDEFGEVDHLILNEAEVTLPPFLEDLRNGCAKHVYTTGQWADVRKTPIPLWELVDMKKYSFMSIQYSRGCPFDCEFCDVTVLYGHRVRTKDKGQLIAELESLYSHGWRWEVFFVDDNLIVKKEKLKTEILPAIAEWREKRGYAFSFYTQVTIDLADDEELMRLMVEAGFFSVYVGIESPNEDSLVECNKSPNLNRDLMACVKRIQECGIEVQAGFIVGFDSDPPSIFEKQIEFIEESDIVVAIVSILGVFRGTKLYHRLQKENRLLKESSGGVTDCSVDFVPKMSYKTLSEGYRNLLKKVYSPEYYYKRARKFLKRYEPLQEGGQFRFSSLVAFFVSMVVLGLIHKERFHYWRLFLETMFTRPRLLPLAIAYAIHGFHFRNIFERYWSS